MDFTSPINCLTFNLQRAARALNRRLDGALAPVGLTAQQFGAVAMLAGHGQLSTSRLAELVGAERTTVTRNMALLREKGLVEPADETDRRVHALKLTARGYETFQAAMPLWREAQNASLADLAGADAEAFLDTLRGF